VEGTLAKRAFSLRATSEGRVAWAFCMIHSGRWCARDVDRLVDWRVSSMECASVFWHDFGGCLQVLVPVLGVGWAAWDDRDEGRWVACGSWMDSCGLWLLDRAGVASQRCLQAEADAGCIGEFIKVAES